MAFNKLKGKLVEMKFTYMEAAIAVGVSETSFVSKINGRSSWKREEMELLCKLLKIPLDQMHLFFYE